MSRSLRLLRLIDLLRRHRRPVAGAALAAELGVSLRSLYRDIAALQALGATVEGEAGVGYVLKPGFLTPPLMFSDEEIEAIVLGSRWVAQNGDDGLADAARAALAKLIAVLPADLKAKAEATPWLVGVDDVSCPALGHMPHMREAIRAEKKVAIAYADAEGILTERTIWPFALAFFESTRIVAAWCELREDFRHFRADRIRSVTVSEQRYPRRRAQLIAQWRQVEGIPPQ